MIVKVVERNGKVKELEAVEGWRLMEIIRDWGLDIKAECGGSCMCATCHVYVDEKWTDKLPEKSEEEEEMLDSAFEVKDNSRLSCQIIMSEKLNGLKVSLAPGTEKE